MATMIKFFKIMFSKYNKEIKNCKTIIFFISKEKDIDNTICLIFEKETIELRFEKKLVYITKNDTTRPWTTKWTVTKKSFLYKCWEIAKFFNN